MNIAWIADLPMPKQVAIGQALERGWRLEPESISFEVAVPGAYSKVSVGAIVADLVPDLALKLRELEDRVRASIRDQIDGLEPTWIHQLTDRQGECVRWALRRGWVADDHGLRYRCGAEVVVGLGKFRNAVDPWALLRNAEEDLRAYVWQNREA